MFLVVTVFDSIANLQHRRHPRRGCQEWLSTPTGQGLGLSVAEAARRCCGPALNVTGVCAAAAAVLGFFVLQRHRGARIALTIVAVPPDRTC